MRWPVKNEDHDEDTTDNQDFNPKVKEEATNPIDPAQATERRKQLTLLRKRTAPKRESDDEPQLSVEQVMKHAKKFAAQK